MTVVLTEEDLCRHIRDSVLEQRLAPGTKLTEESLCSIFGVGRTTVRRAFLLLSKDQIVELEKNKGAVVASPSPEEAQQIFEARAIMEAALLEKAVEKATKDDLAMLQEHLLREQEALSNANIALWIRLTGEFHMHLAKLAKNDPMCAFLEQLVFQTSLIIALYGRRGAAPSCKGGDHEMLVDAISRKDAITAKSILLKHLRAIEGQLTFEPRDSHQDLHLVFADKIAS